MKESWRTIKLVKCTIQNILLVKSEWAKSRKWLVWPFTIKLLRSGKDRVYLLLDFAILLLRNDQPSQSSHNFFFLCLMLAKHSSNTIMQPPHIHAYTRCNWVHFNITLSILPGVHEYYSCTPDITHKQTFQRSTLMELTAGRYSHRVCACMWVLVVAGRQCYVR